MKLGEILSENMLKLLLVNNKDLIKIFIVSQKNCSPCITLKNFLESQDEKKGYVFYIINITSNKDILRSNYLKQLNIKSTPFCFSVKTTSTGDLTYTKISDLHSLFDNNF